MRAFGSFLLAVLRLPLEVYLTLYTRLVFLGSLKNPRNIAEGAAIGLITVTKVFFIMAFILYFWGIAEFPNVAVLGLIFFLMFALDYLVLSTMGYGTAFGVKLASMPTVKQRLLDILATSWVIFTIAFFVWAVPPVQSNGSP